MKACRCCGESKPIDRFQVCKRRKDGTPIHRGQCRDCMSKKQVERIKSNPEQAKRKRERDNRWRNANPERVSGYKARQRENMRQYNRRRVDLLDDAYIRNRLGLKVTDEVPQELIESKRLQIETQRLLEDMGYERHRRVAGRFS